MDLTELRLQCIKTAASLPGISAVDPAEAGRKVVTAATEMFAFVQGVKAPGPDTLHLPKKTVV